MAGSYAHNIKNLLVRPNDLLRRCLDETSAGDDQAHMLREVKQTWAPSPNGCSRSCRRCAATRAKSEKRAHRPERPGRGDATDLGDLAREKWKLALELEPSSPRPPSLWIEGDLSHLQQALENLLFNARDATFEMRNHLREQARRLPSQVAPRHGGPEQTRPGKRASGANSIPSAGRP